MTYNYFHLNNPGNIGYSSWTASHGGFLSSATDTGHYIAGFPDLTTGFNAMSALALNKYNNGATTLNQLIAGPGGWTPGNYGAASNIAQTMGISPNQDLNLTDPNSMSSFQRALTIQETGSAQQYNQFAGGYMPSQPVTQSDGGLSQTNDGLQSLSGTDSGTGAYGDITGYSVAGVNAPLDSSGSSGIDTSQGGVPVLGGSPSTSPDAMGYPAMGVPGSQTANSTNWQQYASNPAPPTLGGQEAQAAATQGSGQNIQSGLQTAGQDIKSAEQSAATTGTGWLSSIFGGATDFLVRGGLITLGLVMLIGAFLLLYGEKITVTQLSAAKA